MRSFDAGFAPIGVVAFNRLSAARPTVEAGSQCVPARKTEAIERVEPAHLGMTSTHSSRRALLFRMDHRHPDARRACHRSDTLTPSLPSSDG